MAISTLSPSANSRYSATTFPVGRFTDGSRFSRPSNFNTNSSMTLRLSLLRGGLPKSEACAIENEVATYHLLSKAGLPVPTILDLSRSKKTCRILSATLSEPAGIPLLSAVVSSTDIQRDKIDSQVERAKQVLADQRNAAFGGVAAVAVGRGLKAWSLAFAVMLETLLEDGEDHFVNLPYAEIRQLATKSRVLLDRCTQARLVVPTFGNASHVFVDVGSSNVTGFVGCKDAYWGDPALIDQNTQIPVYRCYQEARKIIAKHLRPSANVGADILEARSNLVRALAAQNTALT